MRHTYILQCSDDTLYTGVTMDLERRVEEHNSSPKGATYTKSRRPVKLVWSCKCKTRSSACKKEWEIKQMGREEKTLFINK
ncbi:GIY-YIG nuclease family protein [Candidatus Gracilibacteria bacterium]|nr:GIY-YIG nuclease family protein [Candidatus Gracilibacteria bacterium]